MSPICRSLLAVLALSSLFTVSTAFSIATPQHFRASGSLRLPVSSVKTARTRSSTRLFMSSPGGGGGSSTEKSRGTQKGVQVMDRTETKAEEKKKPESEWRVVLHNDEVHTFNYVVRSLCKVIGTLDRKAAFEICVQTHGIGKATITKTWKKQAEQFCLGLQRQGLTVSIAPDEDFDGGHSGGGL